MMSYADQVIISGQPSSDSIGNLLYTSGAGGHTSVIYLNRHPGMGKVVVNVSQYVWEHKSQRPNTFSYPVACPLCHCVYPWQSIPTQVAAMGSAFTLRCKTKLESGGKCKGTWDIPARPSSSVINNPYVGTWRKI